MQTSHQFSSGTVTSMKLLRSISTEYTVIQGTNRRYSPHRFSLSACVPNYWGRLLSKLFMQWLFPENGRWPPHVGGVRLGWRLGWKTIFLIVSRGQTIHPTPVWGPHTEPKFRADRNRAIVWTKRPKKMPLFDRNVPKWPVLGYTHFSHPDHFPYRHGQVLKAKKVPNVI